ncbi:MAG: ABC transporter permease [Chloroflexi bacterium]|jgi:peptide/nickel transport system permease protein|nr:ABC transporter permease [Verrucomicrobiota bacterium]MDA1282595.1 ABC transporter permease [Chloroflexota bacterium]
MSLAPKARTEWELAPPLSTRLKGMFGSTYKAAKRDIVLAVSIMVLLVGLFLAIFGPSLARTDYERTDPINRMQAPSTDHWFGTDNWGRDVFDRTIVGTRLSFLVGFSVTLISTVIGVGVALVISYFKLLDSIMMRFVDGLLAFPTILLALALISLIGPSVGNVIIALSLTATAGKIRLVRGAVLSLRDSTYVDAARAVGVPVPRILLLHLLPNITSIIIVQATFTLASAILAEASLSFLGAGVPEYVPSWGNIIATGQGYIQVGFHISFFPGLFLMTTVLAVVLIGDSVRDHLDPKLRGRLKTTAQQ